MARNNRISRYAAVIDRLRTVDFSTPVPVQVPEDHRTKEGLVRIAKHLRSQCRYYGMQIALVPKLDGTLAAFVLKRTNGD